MSNRRVSQILRSQAEDLAFMVMDAGRPDYVEQISNDEISFELKRLSRRIELEISCRCFKGKIILYNNGDIVLSDDDDNMQEIVGQINISKWIAYTFKLSRNR